MKDSRLILGVDYYKDPLFATPLAFDIVTENELKTATESVSDTILDGKNVCIVRLRTYALYGHSSSWHHFFSFFL